MKKLLVLITTLAMTLSLAGCGGDSGSSNADTPASTPAEAAPATTDITLVSKEANYTTLLVPSDFGEFYDKDGYAVAEGPSASIVVTPTTESDTNVDDITQDFIVESLADVYTNIEVLAFDNPANIAGVDSICCLYTGDGNTSGDNKTVCQIIMFFSIDGVNCEQHIVFTYNTGENTSLEASLAEILQSISLE